MSFYNTQFGDLNFGTGIFGNVGDIESTGIVWTDICPVLSGWDNAPIDEVLWGDQAVNMSAWANESIDNTGWNNQAANSDIWNKIPSEIRKSTRCRRD